MEYGHYEDCLSEISASVSPKEGGLVEKSANPLFVRLQEGALQDGGEESLEGAKSDGQTTSVVHLQQDPDPVCRRAVLHHSSK